MRTHDIYCTWMRVNDIFQFMNENELYCDLHIFDNLMRNDWEWMGNIVHDQYNPFCFVIHDQSLMTFYKKKSLHDNLGNGNLAHAWFLILQSGATYGVTSRLCT